MMTWWQQFVAACAGLTVVLALLGLIGAGMIRYVRLFRKFGRLLDQFIGDENARPPIPSLMDQVGELRTEQARLADEMASHVRWHGAPTPRPAGNGVIDPNVRARRAR